MKYMDKNRQSDIVCAANVKKGELKLPSGPPNALPSVDYNKTYHIFWSPDATDCLAKAESRLSHIEVFKEGADGTGGPGFYPGRIISIAKSAKEAFALANTKAVRSLAARTSSAASNSDSGRSSVKSKISSAASNSDSGRSSVKSKVIIQHSQPSTSKGPATKEVTKLKARNGHEKPTRVNTLDEESGSDNENCSGRSDWRDREITELKSKVDSLSRKYNNAKKEIEYLREYNTKLVKLNVEYQEGLMKTLLSEKAKKDRVLTTPPAFENEPAPRLHPVTIDDNTPVVIGFMDTVAAPEQQIMPNQPNEQVLGAEVQANGELLFEREVEQTEDLEDGMVDLGLGIKVNRDCYAKIKDHATNPLKQYPAGEKGEEEWIRDAAVSMWGNDVLRARSVTGKSSNANIKLGRLDPAGDPLTPEKISTIQGALKRRILNVFNGNMTEAEKLLLAQRVKLSRVRRQIGVQINNAKRRKVNPQPVLNE